MSKKTAKPAEFTPPEARLQETALVRYRDERNWDVNTSDLTMYNLLVRRGWKPVLDSQGVYARFKLPKAAISVRAAKSVGKKRQPK